MTPKEWYSSLKRYEGADFKKSIGQLAVTLAGYTSLVFLMFFLVLKELPYWVVLLIAFPAAGFHVKLFIILHDCSHSSFFKNSRANSIVGNLCGILTFTPFYDWKHSHAVHHATVSNLDKRGTGDVWTMTVREYKTAPLREKIRYRIFRNPLFLFGIAPLFLFLVLFRLPHRGMSPKDLKSILLTDLVLALIIVGFSLTLGFSVWFWVMFPILAISTISGTWLFFIQHQFKTVYWSRSTHWNKIRAALEGSSFYKLPAVLRWFSGNIGYHHIHHLNSLIPNYRLPKVFWNIPQTREVTPIGFFASLKSLFLFLWDENTGELVSFRAAKRL